MFLSQFQKMWSRDAAAVAGARHPAGQARQQEKDRSALPSAPCTMPDDAPALVFAAGKHRVHPAYLPV